LTLRAVINQIGQTQTISNVPISAGVFTVTLDFGANAFTGASRFLEISMRPSGGAVFTPFDAATSNHVDALCGAQSERGDRGYGY
jgi:hypothetical protein